MFFFKRRKIKKILFLLFDKYEAQFSKTALNHFLDSSRVDVNCGEWGLAFDNFCSNLYEFDIEISKEDFELIKECAFLMQMSDETWNFLEPLVK